ncbi:hypothetical protein, variant 1 [Aphanomyces invadans]|uniref:ABC transporter domain-containing protein n=1 Tax=Aphanomyces invadans TaxID=157072 RepID=A0A024TX36_9STRA|nr:hypothetical protein, variant 1 [Aphanomyces invadans]ETV98201.1 hypothetical protein, variant 1 [Aphanomyces invadans]|eukprot:XP_008873076.1 hypothetical protein, variant 1 [Aphanomyces invadans]
MAATASKYAAFVNTLKAQGASELATEICVSGLTWRKPWKDHREFVLFDVTARFKPGSMTLVLGPPGCGKTSLLKAIAGVFSTAPLNESGGVTFNGIATNRLPAADLRSLVTFAGQRDEHIPTLTVHETLEFAHACRSQTSNAAVSFDAAVGTDAIIDMLGLTGCQHTLVGDDYVRGVSGGQRRRVTLGEMLTGRSPVLVLDEYTTGLDTTVATDITQKLRDMCKAVQYTVVTALLQPPPEVFALFDNVLILTEGHVAYFGPTADATAYFEALGFTCPASTDDADFLQEVASVYGVAFKAPGVGKVPETPVEFHQAFKESSWYSTLHVPRSVAAVTGDGIGRKVVPSDSVAPPATSPSPPSSAGHGRSAMSSARRVLQRQLKLVVRDTKFNMIRFGQSILMGVAIGSLFGKLGYDPPNVPSKIGLMFLTLLFTSVITLANIAYTIQLRRVFQKQALFQLYPAWTYAAAESVVEVACTFVQVFLFTVTTYWMCEFSPVGLGERYGVYYAIIFLNSVSATQAFKCIAAFAPSAVSGLILGAAVCFVLIIFSGFAIPGPSIPTYFVWLFNVNPSSWAFWAIMINEYTSALPAYDAPHPKLPMRTGDYYVKLYGVPVDTQYVGWAITYLGGLYVGLVGLTAIGYRFVRYRKTHASPAPTAVDPLRLRSMTGASPNVKEIVASAAFAPVMLTVRDVHYSIPMPRKNHQPDKRGATVDLLSGIHGQFAPGTMTALMGTSGAGKSTLLDVLAGRKNSGKIKGSMHVNGMPLTRAVQKQFGYVEQFDLHCLTATVEEALEFSAHLRLPGASVDDIKDVIQSTLDTLELRRDRGKRISILSNEQSKRVTIGVELVANPSVLFLDEPTSGLDVHAAKVVLDAIYRIARSGRTVICTIHQPSFALFEMFDALVLLRTGGKMVYVGPLNGGKAIVEYLERIPGTRKLLDRENPATYMLDVMAANPSVDFSSIYMASSLCAANDAAISAGCDGSKRAQPSAGGPATSRTKATSYGTQLYYLGLRTARKYWRTREYSVGRVLISIFVAIIFGVLYEHDDGLHFTSQLQSQASLVFVGPLFMGIISVITGAMHVLCVSMCSRGD